MSHLTAKHFAELAFIIKTDLFTVLSNLDPKILDTFLDDLCILLRSTNNRFDAARFKNSCKKREES